MKNIMLRIWAAIAIHWLKSDFEEAKVELITTKNFILKAERKHTFDIISCMKKAERTFSIHRHVPPNTVGPRDMWTYDKYIVDENCHYKHLRSGKYPGDWE